MIKKDTVWLAVIYVLLLCFAFASCIKSQPHVAESSYAFIYSEHENTNSAIFGLEVESFSESSFWQADSSTGGVHTSSVGNVASEAQSTAHSIESRGNEMSKTTSSVQLEESKPTESSKPAEASKPAEGSKPAESSKPAEGSKPAESSKPTESSKPAENSKPPENSEPPKTPAPVGNDYLKAIWVSQYDMSSVYVSGGVQRSKSSYTSLVEKIVTNIKKDGFNTIFLQVRPFGDSFYPSDYYPLSSFVAGRYGGSISYDPIEIFIAKASAAGLSVHAWINPMRLMLTSEIAAVPDKYLIKKWYREGGDRVVEFSGRLYLNPAYPETRQLIIDGAAEILKKYNVDGIHIDDYFYPTKDASFDALSFSKSGYSSLQAFRENNIKQMVSGLHKAVHSTKSQAVFGVSPAGNLDDLRSVYFIDVKKWCAEDGYLDYIIPQLYYGFLHGVCPFDKMVDKWAAIVTNPKVKYYVGLSGGNAYSAYSGNISVWAVTEAGKNEWINHKDVLKRSFEYIFGKNAVDGYSFFCYQYLYSPTTGTATPALAEEYANFINLIR